MQLLTLPAAIHRFLMSRRVFSSGGEHGGKARARALTKEQRQEIARKAAAARWGRTK
jgi:hypothetical protein